MKRLFLLFLFAFTAGSLGCITMDPKALAAATHLKDYERGVVVANYVNEMACFRVETPGVDVNGPELVCLAPFERHAFVLYGVGGHSVTVVAYPKNLVNSGLRLASAEIRFPFGHYVGNVDYSRNHKMLFYDGRSLKESLKNR